MCIAFLGKESNLTNSTICLDIDAGDHSISNSDSFGRKSRHFRIAGYLKNPCKCKITAEVLSIITTS